MIECVKEGRQVDARSITAMLAWDREDQILCNARAWILYYAWWRGALGYYEGWKMEVAGMMGEAGMVRAPNLPAAR